MVDKVDVYIEKTEYNQEENKILETKSYLDVHFPPLKIPDRSHQSKNRYGLTPSEECFKVVDFK